MPIREVILGAGGSRGVDTDKTRSMEQGVGHVGMGRC